MIDKHFISQNLYLLSNSMQMTTSSTERCSFTYRTCRLVDMSQSNFMQRTYTCFNDCIFVTFTFLLNVPYSLYLKHYSEDTGVSESDKGTCNVFCPCKVLSNVLDLCFTLKRHPGSYKITSKIGLFTVFDAMLTSRQTCLEITVFVWKSNVK